jgi:signal transduction histidine kinase
VERERARIAQDLHDDLGTSLTRINLLSGLVSHEHTPETEIGPLTRQIRSTSREMVNRLNEIVWAVNPKHDRLGELLGYLGNFAESFCRDARWRCRLKIAPEIPDRPIRAEVRHNLYLAFKEAVNNAIRHSGGTELRIQATVEQDQLLVSVCDNGKGLSTPAPDQRRGHGLDNMRQRLERLGGICNVQSSPQGCTVEFRLPLD